MGFALIHSRALEGISAPLVTVEAHLSSGLPGFSIVGLPETAVKESRDRVRSAIINSGFDFPARRITVNLGPADLPKEGTRFDLAISLAILMASGQVPAPPADHEFLGELALSGALRPIFGILSAAFAAKQNQHILFAPQANASEASFIEDLCFYPAAHLREVCAHLSGTTLLKPYESSKWPSVAQTISTDFNEVRGQTEAKRALLIAAAGGHHLLMSGPPGTGKTMLASRFCSLLPPLSTDEALALAMLHALRGHPFQSERFYERPFRSPHHTSSGIALVGGGSHPKPGEISLAHHGVLFLDELPEFDRKVLEVLREPIESGKIHLARAQQQVTYPCEFQLIAAMNPCPCGYLGSRKKVCSCTPAQIQRYRAKLSGPFLDRMDLHVEVHDLPEKIFSSAVPPSENSAQLRERVIKARDAQHQRQGKLNKALSVKELETHCALASPLQTWLQNALQQLQISARSYHRLLRVARSIADLDANPSIEQIHLTEALLLKKEL